jgi:O-methyltransferase
VNPTREPKPDVNVGTIQLPTLLSLRDLQVLSNYAFNAPLGDFAEIGVYRGGSAALLYEIAEQQGRTLHLYDTFAGHPEVHTDHDDRVQHPPGHFAEAIDPEALQRLLPNAVLHIGVFPETLVDMTPLAFVHSDADLYAPTRAVCDLLPPMMVPGGFILFDDYSYTNCPGERRAVDEVFGAGDLLATGKRLVTIPGAK